MASVVQATVELAVVVGSTDGGLEVLVVVAARGGVDIPNVPRLAVATTATNKALLHFLTGFSLHIMAKGTLYLPLDYTHHTNTRVPSSTEFSSP